VFVRKGGSLTVQASGNRAVSGNSAAAGTGYRNGAAAGGGFFVMSGAAMSDTALAFDISGRYTISDDIGDDSPTGLPAGQSYTPGAGSGITIFKVGTGTLVLDSSNTFSGLVAVGAGALAGNGDVPAQVLLADGAAIAPGNPAIAGGIGTLSIGQLVWTPGSSISFQLGKTQAESDLLMVNGGLIKSGSGLPLRVNFSMGAKPPVPGTTYALLTAQSLAGVSASDFYHAQDATYGSLTGSFSVVGNSVTFTVDSVTSDRIFADSFD
jgi:autotransporter-associated beta strand protein